MEFESSFMHFLLQHQQKHSRSLNFLILMESILTAAKQIAHSYRLAELDRITGEAGKHNVQGESVMKLDVLAHEIIIHHLRQSGQVIEAISEEDADPIKLNKDGRYLVYFDPLDGSSNVKHSLPVGLMFGIAKRNLEKEEDCRLRKGSEYIASGMFLLPSGQFTFALKDAGAWRFLLDETGSYVRPSKISFPTNKENWELSWNSGNRYYFKDKVQKWIKEHEENLNFRYIGALAVDFHRLLHNGGMFLYPAITQHSEPSKNRARGKLRLLYESNVVGLIAQEAGGIAIDENGENVLNIDPEDRHQRSALYVGNMEIVKSVRKVLKS
ncbi:UNVERIFIED_CONTAM: hypothetical protein GTU68_005011 [Idotea baltica]|nr:hypothetical protein [Idotea baltica]